MFDFSSKVSAILVALGNLFTGVQAFAAGWHHTCAVMQTGGVLCWGIDDSDQPGFAGAMLRTKPVAVLGTCE